MHGRGEGAPAPVRRRRRAAVGLAALAVLGAVAGCRQDMHDQPKYEPYERSRFFDDQRASRPPVPGTVARGHLDADTAFYTGVAGAAPVATNPLPATPATLRRGQERYNIYCAPCHDRVGTGAGMIVQRGYKRPPTFHDDRMRGVPDGYLFQVMVKGFGVMPSYAEVPAVDRWAIVAYIRALQLSQHATLADVPEAERPVLEAAP